MNGAHQSISALCCLTLWVSIVAVHSVYGPSPVAAEPRFVPVPPQAKVCKSLPRSHRMWFGFGEGMGLGSGEAALSELQPIQQALGQLACKVRKGPRPVLLERLEMLDARGTRARVGLKFSNGSQSDWELRLAGEAWQRVQPMTVATTSRKPAP